MRQPIDETIMCRLTMSTLSPHQMTTTRASSALFRRLMIMLFAVATLLSAGTQGARAGSCAIENFIIGAGQAYDRAARANSAAAFSSAVTRYSDMRSVALFALGRYRKDLPKQDAAEYFRLTRQFMGRFMLEHGKDLRVGRLNVISCTGPSSNILVKARTSNGQDVSFRVYRARGGYLVRDMQVQGIWLVQRMRSTFVGTLQRTKGSFRELFKFLRNY